MLASTIISDARRELLEYSAQLFWSDAELLRLLNRAETDYVNRTRILEDKAMMTLMQGRSDYPLPSNWISARLVMMKKVDSTGKAHWTRIYPTNLEKVAQEHPDFIDETTDHQGQPQVYHIWANNIIFTPTPDALSECEVYLFYKSKPITIVNPSTDSINIDDTLAEGLTAYVLWKAWSKEKETDLAEEQKRIYFDYVGEGRRWLKKKSGDQRYKIDIDSPSPFYRNSSYDF